MRPPACTVAHRVSKQCPQLTNVVTMSKDVYPIRRAQLIHHPRACKPLGPITLLPAEVLANIFLYSVSGVSEASASNATLILTQVCSSWRRVALAIPQLWENLNLNLTIKPTLPPNSPFARPPSTSSKTPQALASLASLWFERARNQLLSVSIELTASSAAATHDVSSSLARPILSNARAIRHLSISVTSSSQLQRFLTSEGANFANLESLSLSIRRFDAASSSPITVFNSSPRLTRVSFDFSGLPPSPSLIRLPWSQLEQFDMTGASILPADGFHTLLSTCVNLRKASIWVEDAMNKEVRLADEVAAITLPSLTKLSISFYGRNEKTANSLLSAFDLPHLRHFHFFSGFITLPFMPTINSHQLETLVLSGVNVSAEAFLTFATAHSSLHSLTLDLRYFDEDNISNVLDILAAGRSGPRFLAHLTNLSLWTRDISSYSSAFLRMVCARGRYSSSRGDIMRLVLFLARQQHGSCCYFSTCSKPLSGSLTRLDDILAIVDLCESTAGIELYVSDVGLNEGICEVA